MKQVGIVVLLLILSLNARAELVIEITSGNQSAIPIAVVPFKVSGGKMPTSVFGIIEKDLERSGYFKGMKIANMLQKPFKENQVRYLDWQRSNQDYVTIGEVTVTASSYRVSFTLMDVFRKRTILKKTLIGRKSQLRDLAHKISDLIFEKITGTAGVFSTKIAYVTANKKRNRFQINYADADGARERVLFRSKHPIISPAWTPDGKSLAYVSFENGFAEIYLQNIKSKRRKKIISFKGNSSAPAFSPDAKKLAYVRTIAGNTDIYVMDLTTRRITRATKHYGIDTEPQWLPDGKGFIFTSNRSGGPQIYKKDLRTGRSRRMTFNGSYNARPRLTPDGSKMVMVHRAGRNFHIASQAIDGGMFRILSRQTKLDESPSVAPNGSMVIYAATEGNRRILAVVSVDGEVKFRLPSRYGDVREPVWSPIPKKLN